MNGSLPLPQPPANPRRRRGRVFILVILLCAAAYVLGVVSAQAPSFRRLVSENTGNAPIFTKIEEVWATLKQEHAGNVPSEAEAVYGAIRGLVQSLDDPYTVFFTPKENRSFQEEIQGMFEGIGAEIGMKNDQLVVIAPLPGTPAEKAGLLPGDEILFIGDAPTLDFSLDEAVEKIRGKQGTTVTLKIRRAGAREMTEMTIERRAITIQSVKLSFLDGSIAHLELSYFGPKTAQEFSSAINEIVVKGAKGIVLDLRSNPGGYLDAAVDVSSHFVEEGKIVVAEQFPDGRRETYTARRLSSVAGVPLVVLIDQGSASGSEIVAGALQDYKLGTLIGVQTYGKGSVQELKEFEDGSSLKLTVATWFTPNGRSINEQGITPDVEVQRSAEDITADRDPQLDKAVELLRSEQKQEGA
ncbi:MAG: S41 family peptidase [Candidatus Kerfeldbacteria bacterium]|nr:S41 family peptidase [Candidatus Kerfeldbacteria bacterium]